MPLQMAEKSWVNIDAFIEAWLAALSYRGVKYPRVAEAIELARSNALAIKRYNEAFKAYFEREKRGVSHDTETIADMIRGRRTPTRNIRLHIRLRDG